MISESPSTNFNSLQKRCGWRQKPRGRKVRVDARLHKHFDPRQSRPSQAVEAGFEKLTAIKGKLNAGVAGFS